MNPPKGISITGIDHHQGEAYVYQRQGQPGRGDCFAWGRGGVLKKVWKDLPPDIGVHKGYDYVTSKYVGITRQKVFDFMRKNKYYQQFQQRRNASHSKAIVSTRAGVRGHIDYWYMPQSVPHNGRSYKGALTIVDCYSKLVQIKPIWGDENGAKDAAALKEFLDGPYDKDVKIVKTDNGTSLKTGHFHDLPTG